MTRIWLSIALASWAGLAVAQDSTALEELPQSAVIATSVLTVDVDGLFTQSQFGVRVLEEYTTQGEALAAENRRIAEALREEELTLAAQRADMAVDVFLAEAEAFDEKAQAIRRAQDAKERVLETLLSEGRDRFLVVSRPILGDLMIERGASAILDRRSVLLSLGSIDVTEDAVARIDAELGDGTVQETDPEPEETTVQD
ncbi:OmpH family outer membrane protein [Octadecabacter sp.]|nr:OmpH family outer membrane protein [Octadecabacter sp.]